MQAIRVTRRYISACVVVYMYVCVCVYLCISRIIQQCLYICRPLYLSLCISRSRSLYMYFFTAHETDNMHSVNLVYAIIKRLLTHRYIDTIVASARKLNSSLVLDLID